MSTIGNSIPRIDAIAKVTGKAKYPGDFQFSDQLAMKVLFAHRAMPGCLKSIPPRQKQCRVWCWF
jgi:CO/xanthine dehydrogenase Mo-binding subunit